MFTSSRNALYTRFSLNDWNAANVTNYTASDKASCGWSERHHGVGQGPLWCREGPPGRGSAVSRGQRQDDADSERRRTTPRRSHRRHRVLEDRRPARAPRTRRSRDVWSYVNLCVCTRISSLTPVPRMTRRRAAPRANAASAYVASERREYWKTEVLSETDQMITEMDALSRAKAALEKMIADLETPLPEDATLPWIRHTVLETPLLAAGDAKPSWRRHCRQLERHCWCLETPHCPGDATAGSRRRHAVLETPLSVPGNAMLPW